MPTAADARRRPIDLARDAVFNHALAVALGPLLWVEGFTDIGRPQCRRISRRRAVCRYWFESVHPRTGLPLHREQGYVYIKRGRVRVVPDAWTRNAAPARGPRR